MYRCLLWSFWLSYLAFSFGYVSNLQIFQILSLSHIDPLIIEDDDPALSQSLILSPPVFKKFERMTSWKVCPKPCYGLWRKQKSYGVFWISVVLSKRRHTLWSEFLNFIFKINFSVFSKLRVYSTTVHAPADTAFIQRNTDTLTLVMKVRRYIHSNGCLQQSVE